MRSMIPNPEKALVAKRKKALAEDRDAVRQGGYASAARTLLSLLSDVLRGLPGDARRDRGAWLRLRVLEDRLSRSLSSPPDRPVREHREFIVSDLQAILEASSCLSDPQERSALRRASAALRFADSWPSSWEVFS